MKRKDDHTTRNRAGSGTQEGFHAREAILEAVRRARLPAVPLPSITGVRDTDTGDLVSRFMASVEAAAAAVQIVETGEVEAAVRERFPEAASIATTAPAWAFDRVDALPDAPAHPDARALPDAPALPDTPALPDAPARTDVPALPDAHTHPDAPAHPGAPAHPLAGLDVLVCPGELGVAENGAVWLGESGMGPRAAPFLTQHLVLVLDRSVIVPDMHAAYDSLDVAREGYGVFVAGPSKTADIEQALVIGAHGPRSLTVLLT